MSDKPTEVADWAPANPGPDIVIPSSGEKSAGWQPLARPPAQHVNWFWELLSQWIAWISAGLWTRPSLTDNTPVVGTTDRTGRIRHYLGPEGYWMGPAIQARTEWANITANLGVGVDSGHIYDRFFGTTDAQTAVSKSSHTLLTPNTNFTPLGFFIDDLSTDEATRIHTAVGGGLDHADIDNLSAVFEVRLQMDNIGANGVDVNLGLHADSDLNTAAYIDGTIHAFAMFEKLSADTNWQCRTADGTAESTPVDSSVPPVADTFQTFRLEYHGLNTPVGAGNGFATVRFFIDGAEVAELKDTNVPNGSNTLGFSLRARSNATGPTGDFNMYIGPIKYAYNEVLAGDIPA